MTTVDEVRAALLQEMPLDGFLAEQAISASIDALIAAVRGEDHP